MFACQRVSGLAEFLEDEVLLLAGDADAGVHDRNGHVLRIGFRLELNASAFGSELYRVRQQILQDLLELGDVLPKHRNVRLDLTAQVDILLLGQRAEHVEQALADIVQVEVIEPDLHLARFDLSEIENIVNEVEQFLPAGLNIRQPAALFVR